MYAIHMYSTHNMHVVFHNIVSMIYTKIILQQKSKVNRHPTETIDSQISMYTL